MNPKQIKHDKFCWKCCDEFAELKCSACKRSFHMKCIMFDRDDSKQDNWICDVCDEIDDWKKVNGQYGVEMLKVIVNRVFADSSYNQLKQPLKNSSYAKNQSEGMLVNPINLGTLYKKANANAYSSFAEFLADAHWIYHNNVILFSETNDKTKTSRILIDYFNEEIDSVKKCAECYRNANDAPDNWFTLVCDEPHLIVWAKMKGFNFWPAKLMSIDGQLVNVRFFGDHTHADVPATNCYLYTTQNPGRTRNSTSSHTNALKEAEQYIENIVKKFGSFKMVAESVVLNPAKLNDYLSEAIPGIAEFQQDKQNSLSDAKNDDEFEDDSITVDENQMDTSSEQSSMISNMSNMEAVVNLTRIDDKRNHTASIEKSDQVEDQDNDENLDLDEDHKSETEPIDDTECEVQNKEADEVEDPKNDEHQSIKVDESITTDRNECVEKVQCSNTHKSPFDEDEPSAKRIRLNSSPTVKQMFQNAIDLETDDENDEMCSLQDAYLAIEMDLEQNAMQMLNGLKKFKEEVFQQKANDRRSMKRALNESYKQQHFMNERIERLEETVKMLKDANALLQATDSKHKCAKCGKPIETVLLCNAGTCGQIVLNRPDTESPINDQNETDKEDSN